MATPPSSPPSGSANLARQQLDELDALLQRMLELPVHQLDEGPASTEPAAGPSLSVLEPLSVPADELAGPACSLDVPSPDPDGDTRTLRQPGELTAAPPELFKEDHSRRTARWLGPLAWGNQVFDRWASRLGRPGRWLRRPTGRALLGWTGLLFLAAAVALLVLDWCRRNQ